MSCLPNLTSTAGGHVLHGFAPSIAHCQNCTDGLTCCAPCGMLPGVRVKAASSSSSQEEVLPADVVVIAMGPWSGAAREWLPLPPFSGQKYHSILLQPPEGARVTADCIFTGYKMASGRCGRLAWAATVIWQVCGDCLSWEGCACVVGFGA